MAINTAKTFKEHSATDSKRLNDSIKANKAIKNAKVLLKKVVGQNTLYLFKKDLDLKLTLEEKEQLLVILEGFVTCCGEPIVNTDQIYAGMPLHKFA